METIHIRPPKLLTAWFLRAGVCILLLNLISGCMGSYGRYSMDPEVFEEFNNNQVPRDYRYYYYHSGSEPIAVIGVEKKYDAGSRMWREVDPDTQKFKDMVHWIWEDYGYSRFAARIIDPSGKQVGIMFTSIQEVAIKFTDDNRIVIMPHTPFLWRSEEGYSEETRDSAASNILPSNRHQASNL